MLHNALENTYALTNSLTVSTNQFIIDKDLAEQLAPVTNDGSNSSGHANVFELLLPTLYGQSAKKQQPLEKVDYYMLEETEELIRRLHLYCQQVGVDADAEFKVATNGKQLHIIGDFAGKEALELRVNSDKWFVGSFNWLQPNYANLAHSFEVLEYSYCYEKSPKLAAERFAHLVREDKGLSFALKHAAGMAQAQVETPLNLYCVEG